MTVRERFIPALEGNVDNDFKLKWTDKLISFIHQRQTHPS